MLPVMPLCYGKSIGHILPNIVIIPVTITIRRDPGMLPQHASAYTKGAGYSPYLRFSPNGDLTIAWRNYGGFVNGTRTEDTIYANRLLNNSPGWEGSVSLDTGLYLREPKTGSNQQ